MTNSERPPDLSVALSDERGPGRARFGYALAVGVVAALVALWTLTPLRSYLRVDALTALGAGVRESPFAFLWVLLAYLVSSLLFIPATPLLAATALVFPPVRGLIYGLLATTLAAWVTYEAGRFLRRRRVRWLRGPRFESLCARLQRRGFLTVFIARVLPFGNFTLFNVAAGAMAIPVLPYLAGNALGLLPRMLAFTLLADSLGQALRNPRPRTGAIFCLVSALSALALYWLRRRAARLATSARAP